MVCRTAIKRRDEEGNEEEVPLEEAIEEAEAEATEVEQWNEVSRETQEITVDGVTLDRIVRVTFEKPSGKQIRLNFAEVL